MGVEGEVEGERVGKERLRQGEEGNCNSGREVDKRQGSQRGEDLKVLINVLIGYEARFSGNKKTTVGFPGLGKDRISGG